MDDLVKRLRSVPPCNGCGEYPGGDIAQIMDIAADRIEALERQVKAGEALAELLDSPDQSDGLAGRYHYDWHKVDSALAAHRATEKGGA